MSRASLTRIVCTFLAAIGLMPIGIGAIDPAIVKAYKWRSIGPARGGRSIAASGIKGRRNEAYFGAVGGGLWKTTDFGQEWTPVTDGQLGSSSVGALAVSESNPDVVYIGMGESCIRGNILPGDGVYKSSDAGKTWSHIGFKDSDAISKIRVHPTNPDIVFVADFGKYSKPSAERGIFKSADGGKTWKKVLFRDDKTGGIDIEFDRRNPRVMYAALWEAYRMEYQMSSGGPGCGLFKSTDGGETWTEITRNPGLPQGVDGKMSVAVSGADSNRVYVLLENENGGLFSSDDAGANWKLINSGRNIRQRAFYYTHLFADPNNKDTVYALNTSAFRSTDGGKTLVNIGRGTHGDFHDLWIDPDDSNHLVIGNDGGGSVTFNVSDSKRTWTDQDYATGQFYHVITTKHTPYHVCGAQQDNTTLCVPSDTGDGGKGVAGGGAAFGRIPPEAPYQVGGGEPGYIATDPRNPDVYYAGANNGAFLTRLDRHTGDLKEAGAYPRFFSGEPSSAVKERWQWTYPILFSPADPKTLYTSSQRVWKTTDGGQTWTAISTDLTKHDPKTMQESGGPITHDMNSPEIYATVFALGPGKKDTNLLWAGSDDGIVQVTRDGGKNWTNVTPKEMPELGRVSQIDASWFDPGAAYVAVKRPLLSDYAPYVFRTRDFGRSWTRIVNGIDGNDYVHVVREDPKRRGMLYAGSEHGFYVSFDDGDHWQSLKLNLPDTQVSDIWVEGNDLTIATHGRGFYILDNVTALRETGGEPVSADVLLFKAPDAIRGADAARIDYFLKAPAKKLTIEILDSSGKMIRTYKGAEPKKTDSKNGDSKAADNKAADNKAADNKAADSKEADANAPELEDEEGPRRPPAASMTAGFNRFTWDLRYEPVVSFPGMVLWGATTSGPMALPGTYRVRLTVDGKTLTENVAVVQHPQRRAAEADLRAQFDMALAIEQKVNEANDDVIQIRRIKKEAAERVQQKNDADLRGAADRLTRDLTEVEESLYQVRNRSNQDPLNFPIKTNNRLASLLRVVEAGDGRPTSNVQPIFVDLTNELKGEQERLQHVMQTDLAGFNRLAQQLGVQPVAEKAARTETDIH